MNRLWDSEIEGWVHMVVKMKIAVFWNVTACYHRNRYRRFGRICCLHLRCRRKSRNGYRGYRYREREKKSGVREGEWETEQLLQGKYLRATVSHWPDVGPFHFKLSAHQQTRYSLLQNFYPEDKCTRTLWNVNSFLRNYTATHIRRE
jgi:hypothetical protein